MRLAFTSRRPFDDGPLSQPLPENDQVNMAYVMGADYFSFLTLTKLSKAQLTEKLRPYDIVFVPLDLEDLEGVKQVVAGCNGRYVIYSEGGIADYQLLSPTAQYIYLQLIRHAKALFLYWEKYVPFFESVTTKPVFYLPYPFFASLTEPFYVPLEKRPNRLSLPSGLVGGSRNGLSSVIAARQLLAKNLYQEIDCWLSPVSFREDAETVYQILTDTPLTIEWPTTQMQVRKWLLKLPVDYRPLLKLRRHINAGIIPDAVSDSKTIKIQQGSVALLRRHNWFAYLKRLGHNRLVLDLNNRATVGRNALDCAALSIPCISTAYSDIQGKLFPQTTLDDSWNIPAVVEIARRLQDPGFYHEVTEEAAHHLNEYLPERFKERFDKILVEHPEIWGSDG